MVLYRRGFGLFDQEELAKYFKIKVSKDDADSFNVKLDVYATSSDGGMKTTESEKIINQFFREKKLPLVAKSFRASDISNLEKFISDNLAKNNDLWMEYETFKVHKKPSSKKKWFLPEWMGGHDNVIESIKTEKQKTIVTLVDPFWYNKPRNDVFIEKIKDGLIGFIVISAKK